MEGIEAAVNDFHHKALCYEGARRLRDQAIQVADNLVRAAEQAEKAKSEAEFNLFRVLNRRNCTEDQCSYEPGRKL